VKRRTGTMHGPALQVVLQSVLDGDPLLPGGYSPTKAELFPTPDAYTGTRGGASDPKKRRAGSAEHHHSVSLADAVVGSGQFLPTPTTQDATNLGGEAQGRRRSPGLNWIAPAVAHRDELDPPGEQLMIPMPGDEPDRIDWGPFAPAVERWERLMFRPAPHPLEDGPKGPRLAVAFVEWVMGLPQGWVTDVPGISYRQALTMLGNGCVPQQVAAALEVMTEGEISA
jgi:hypothetical protein